MIIFTSVGAKGNEVILNNQGYQKLLEKNYSDAIDLFRLSNKANPSYKLPLYNLSCAIALLLQTNNYYNKIDLDEYRNYLEEGFSSLKSAIKLDSNYTKKARTDDDLTFYKRYVEFFLIVGYSNKSVDDIGEVINCIKVWYISKEKEMSKNISLIKFEHDEVKINNYYFETERNFRSYVNGKYSISEKEGDVIVILKMEKQKNGKDSFMGVFDKEFNIVFIDISTQNKKTIYYPESCKMGSSI
jgi:hypothetical protein